MKHAIRLANVQVHAMVYIDNIRLRGCKEDVAAAWEALKELCARVNLSIDVETHCASQYDFLGLEYKGHLARLTTKMCKKLRRWQSELETCFHPDFTGRQFLGLFGLLVHCSRITELSCAPFYHVFKLLRRRGAADIDAPFRLWPCLRNTPQQWLRVLLRRHWRDMRIKSKKSFRTIVVSDACPKGWGAICFVDGRCYMRAGTFDREENIAVLECRAFLSAIQLALEIGRSTDGITAFVDNTTLALAFRKGRCNMFGLNHMITTAKSMLHGLPLQVRWLPSAENIADALSRLCAHGDDNMALDDEDVLESLERVSISIC